MLLFANYYYFCFRCRFHLKWCCLWKFWWPFSFIIKGFAVIKIGISSMHLGSGSVSRWCHLRKFRWKMMFILAVSLSESVFRMTRSRLRHSVPVISWTLYQLSKRAERRCLSLGLKHYYRLSHRYYCKSWPKDRGNLLAHSVCLDVERWGGLVWNIVPIVYRNSIDKTFCRFDSTNLLLWSPLWEYYWCLDSMKTFSEGLCPST